MHFYWSNYWNEVSCSGLGNFFWTDKSNGQWIEMDGWRVSISNFINIRAGTERNAWNNGNSTFGRNACPDVFNLSFWTPCTRLYVSLNRKEKPFWCFVMKRHRFLWNESLNEWIRAKKKLAQCRKMEFPNHHWLEGINEILLYSMNNEYFHLIIKR